MQRTMLETNDARNGRCSKRTAVRLGLAAFRKFGTKLQSPDRKGGVELRVPAEQSVAEVAAGENGGLEWSGLVVPQNSTVVERACWQQVAVAEP